MPAILFAYGSVTVYDAQNVGETAATMPRVRQSRPGVTVAALAPAKFYAPAKGRQDVYEPETDGLRGARF